MFLGIYAVILIIFIILLHFGKRAEIRKHGKLRAGYRGAKAAVITLMVFFGFTAGMMQVMTYKFYLVFTEKRKETTAQITGIRDSEDVRYVKYMETFGGQGGTNRSLTLKSRIAPMKMMETCCDGSVSAFTADDGMVYDARILETEDGTFQYGKALPDDTYEQETYRRNSVQKVTGREGCTSYFEYSFGGHRFWVFCYETDDEWYEIRIHG